MFYTDSIFPKSKNTDNSFFLLVPITQVTHSDIFVGFMAIAIAQIVMEINITSRISNNYGSSTGEFANVIAIK